MLRLIPPAILTPDSYAVMRSIYRNETTLPSWRAGEQTEIFVSALYCLTQMHALLRRD